MVLKFILVGGVLPGFLATVVLVVAFLLTRRSGSPRIPAFLFPALAALCIVPAEMLVRERWPSLGAWPTNAADRVLHITFTAAAFGVLTSLLTRLVIRPRPAEPSSSRVAGTATTGSRSSLLITILLAIPACAVCFWMFLSYRVPGFWKTSSTAALWTSLFTLGGVVIIASLELASRRRPRIDTAPHPPHLAHADRDPAVIAILFIIANAIPPMLVKTGNAYLSQISGGIVAAIGAALLVSFLLPRMTITRGGITTLTASLGAIALAGTYFADDPAPRLSMLLLAAAPILAAAVLVLFLRSAGMWKRLLIGAAVAAIPTVIATAIVFLPPAGTHPEASTPSPGYEYEHAP